MLKVGYYKRDRWCRKRTRGRDDAEGKTFRKGVIMHEEDIINERDDVKGKAL